MTDLIGCMVEGYGRKGRVRAVTSDQGGRLICWIEDDGELHPVSGIIRIIRTLPEEPRPIPMPLPPGVR